jgi:hypothetical protein
MLGRVATGRGYVSNAKRDGFSRPAATLGGEAELGLSQEQAERSIMLMMDAPIAILLRAC